MPTANATSGRVWVEQYSKAPTRDWYAAVRSRSTSLSDLVRSASSTSLGRSSDAGARDAWKDRGTPSGRYVDTKCAMYFSCLRTTESSVTAISTFSRSDTGPSSSTFQRAVSASTNSPYSDPGPSSVYNVNRSST
eukprot:161635-Pleurochrysis_carterae.AAC.1